MVYRYLGKSGLKISSIGLGTQTFGWNVDESESKRLLSLYVERGGNYLDAADSYNNGESERVLGTWLSQQPDRDALVIGTKVFFPTGAGPNESGLSRKHILASIDGSLRRLRTDYIDIYQVHCFDQRTPLEETLRTLDDLVHMGKVRYTGASNFTPSMLMKANMMATYEGWTPFSVLQLEYSLLVREPEWELLPLCAQEGLGTLAWSPLAGGWLTGKYRKHQAIPQDSRAGRGDRWDDCESQRVREQTYEIIEVLVAIAEETGRPASQVSLNWILQQGRITSPLIGARTENQLLQNLGAVDWSLTAGQLERLNAVSSREEPSPYRFINHYTRK